MAINKAVISAAGLSSRLYPITNNIPKGLLKIGEKTLLERSIELLRQNNIENILIIVGYYRDKISFNINNINYIVNPIYNNSNNLMSLYFAKEWVNNDPFLYLHSDIIYDEQLLKKILIANCDAALIDKDSNDSEAMMVIDDGHGSWSEAGKGSFYMDNGCGEWTGIASIFNSQQFFKHTEEILEDPENLQAYDVRAISQQRPPLKIISTDSLLWMEIDFKEDLERAKELFINV